MTKRLLIDWRKEITEEKHLLSTVLAIAVITYRLTSNASFDYFSCENALEKTMLCRSLGGRPLNCTQFESIVMKERILSAC